MVAVVLMHVVLDHVDVEVRCFTKSIRVCPRQAVLWKSRREHNNSKELICPNCEGEVSGEACTAGVNGKPLVWAVARERLLIQST